MCDASHGQSFGERCWGCLTLRAGGTRSSGELDRGTRTLASSCRLRPVTRQPADLESTALHEIRRGPSLFGVSGWPSGSKEAA
jgi:hypothetical protein